MQPLAHRPPLGRLCGLAIGLVLLSGSVQAQAPVYRGDSLPVSGGIRRWFLDTVRHHVYMDTTPYWTRLPVENVEELFYCHGMMLLKTKRGWEWWENPTQPRRVYSQFRYDAAGFIGYDLVSNSMMAGTGATQITYNYTNWRSCDVVLEPLDVNGVPCYCVPYNPNNSGRICDDWTCWGMLGPGGRWVIEPRYDSYFRFKDGMAAVRRYGMRMKINERGSNSS
jgi:hypothetical protein